MHDLQSLTHVRWDCKYYRVKRVTGLHFWSRGYFVSTVGLDEKVTRKYIRDQEKLEKQQFDLELD